MSRKHLGLLLKLGVSALLVWFLFRFRDVSSSTLLDAVENPDWRLLGAATLVFLISAVAGAAQWGWILRAPVSTGTAGRETPAGVFSVLEKDKDHRSSLYDDARMPHMLRITWNGIALHDNNRRRRPGRRAPSR